MVDVEPQVVGPQQPSAGAQVGAEVGVAQGGAGGRWRRGRGRGALRPRQGCLRPGQRPAHLRVNGSLVVLGGGLGEQGAVAGGNWKHWEGMGALEED